MNKTMLSMVESIQGLAQMLTVECKWRLFKVEQKLVEFVVCASAAAGGEGAVDICSMECCYLSSVSKK